MKINYNLLFFSFIIYLFFLFNILSDLFSLKNFNIENDLVFFQTNIPKIKIFDNDVGVSCDGHALVRFVQKYSKINPINIDQWVPMIDDEFNEKNKINSKLFTPDFFEINELIFDKQDVAHLWISNRKALNFDPSYKIKQLSADRFYIGKSINNPKLNDLEIKYACMIIPEIKGYFLARKNDHGIEKFFSKYVTTNLNIDLKKMVKDEINFKFYGALNILIITFILILLNNLNILSLGDKNKYITPMIKLIHSYKLFILLPILFLKENYLFATIAFNLFFFYIGLFFIARRP